MTQTDAITFWVQNAQEDAQSAQRNLEHKDYVWALFIWHLSIEKALKALCVKNNQEIPISHNLIKIAEVANYAHLASRKEALKEINTFNIEARYDEYKREFRKKADIIYTSRWQKICQEILSEVIDEINI